MKSDRDRNGSHLHWQAPLGPLSEFDEDGENRELWDGSVVGSRCKLEVFETSPYKAG